MDNVFAVMFNVVAPIFIVIGLSALFAKRFTVDVRTLSRVLIYLFTPALVLDGIATSDIVAEEFGLIVGTALLVTAALWLVGVGLLRVFPMERKIEGAFLMTVILINSGNYGLPLNQFAFGEAGFQRAMVFYVTSAVMAYTVGVYLASRGSAPVRESILNVFKVPLIYAMAAGLLLNFTNTGLPLAVGRAVSLLGDAAVPLMLVILGLQLAETSVKGRLGPIFLAAGTRLLVAPVVAVGIVALLGLTGITRQVVIVQSSMSSAVMSGVLAAEFGSDAEFATAVILVSTLASIVTLSVLLTLVGG